MSLEEKPHMSLSVDLLGVKEPLKREIFSSSNGQQGDLGSINLAARGQWKESPVGLVLIIQYGDFFLIPLFLEQCFPNFPELCAFKFSFSRALLPDTVAASKCS